ncbi:MAG: NAD(P)/FAD-dependent oxidoreductase [Clostridia bacterium]|nr:NAD(P)/FAD-dependent oxidoreductase [Clostridia bacterium]
MEKNCFKIGIIGGGVSGLTAGIYLLQNGFDVELYEKCGVVGGNLTGWHRQGYEIDNCIHWLTGTNPKSPHYKVWKNVGALDKVAVYYAEAFFTAKYNEQTLSLYKNVEKTRAEMLLISREDEREINYFISAVNSVINLLNMAGANNDKSTPFFTKLLSLLNLSRYLNLSAENLANKFKHPLLKIVMGGYIQGEFASLALIVSYAIFASGNGGIPEGGSIEMANNMRRKFEGLGGKIYTNSAVTGAKIVNGKVESIMIKNKQNVNLDYAIFCTDTLTTYSKILNLNTPNAYSKGTTFSSFHTALLIDGSSLPFCDETLLLVKSPYSKFIGKTLTVKNFPYIKNTVKNGKILIETMFICSQESSLKWVKLRKTNIQKYIKRKRAIAKICIKTIEQNFPTLQGKISLLDCWTPASYNRYTGHSGGAYMSNVLKKGQLPHKTSQKIKGLKNAITASQWNNAPGGLPIALEQGVLAYKSAKKYQKLNSVNIKKPLRQALAK